MKPISEDKWLKLVNDKFKDSPVKPSKEDKRDYSLTKLVSTPTGVKLLKASLDYIVPFIRNQLNCPFCAGFAMTNIANGYFNYIGKMPKGGFSPLFTYWKAKEIDGLPDQDGTTLKAVLEVSRKVGLLPEDFLPFTGDCKKPVITDEMIKVASKYKIKAYARLYTYDEICKAIAAGKFVIIGTIVTDINWKDGWILEPKGYFKGAHATFISEFDNTLKYEEDGKLYEQFLGGINSWGTEWGEDGEYWMSKYYTEFKFIDLDNMPALFEAWAVDFETQPEPKIVKDPYENMDIIEMWIDSNKIVDNGKEYTIDQPITVNPKTNRALAPVRFVFERAGWTVDYIDKDKKIVAKRQKM